MGERDLCQRRAKRNTRENLGMEPAASSGCQSSADVVQVATPAPRTYASAMKRIVVSGGTGYIGTALVARLIARGDEVIVLTRGESHGKEPSHVHWDPYRMGDWAHALDGADAVVHLAGERAVGVRYTEAVKRRLYESRVVSTRNIVEAIERASAKPKVLVSASAVGYYGNRPASERVDESAAPGDDFLAKLCVDWEAASHRARELGLRVINPRIGVVLGPGDGPLKVMSLPFKLFVGGKLGSGEQGISWISLEDAVAALVLCIDDDSMPPSVNICSPNPASNAEVSAAIASVLHRPSLFTVPAFGLKALFGEGAETILTGQFAVPGVLARRQFSFGAPTLDVAVRRGLGA